MRIAITGASGLVGGALREALVLRDDEVIRLVRGRDCGEGEIRWSPNDGSIDGEKLEGLDALVCLSGESIASGRWTASRKRRIRESRVNSVQLLSETVAELSEPPRVFVCASAVGYYGARGLGAGGLGATGLAAGDFTTVSDESSPPGDDFLAGVCIDWESAADAARAAGIRVVHLRLGVVLSPKGGALSSMLLPFRLGMGGVLGDGRQRMSWVALPDVIGILMRVIEDEAIEGPVNAVSPGIVTNREFTKTLGKVLRRPTVLPVPRFVLRTILGEMGEALLLNDLAARPAKLLDAGYEFESPTLGHALETLLTPPR